MYPHRIRLRGPWQCQPLARLPIRSDVAAQAEDDPPARSFRMVMPGRLSDAGLHNFAGQVLFRRRFGYPGRLDSIDRVWLTFAGVEGAAEVFLNDRLLGRSAEPVFEFEVTELLRPRNELKVILKAASSEAGLWGEVAMEVRCTAYLGHVCLWADATEAGVKLHVAGKVIGTCERPLDLYVLLDNATVAYTTVEAARAGQPFDLVAEALEDSRPGEAHEVRIELVNGATVWYRIEEPFVFP